MSTSGHQYPTPRLPPRRVLEDASGRRLQRMRWVGRAVALLFLVWLAIVILGGLGVGPVGRLPLGHILRPSAGPPPMRHVPRPVAPAAADLAPALPAPAVVPATATTRRAPRSSTPGKSGTAPGQAKKVVPTTTTSPGRSGSAPGRLKTTTTARGKSATAPGHAKRSTTTSTTSTTTTTATVPAHGRGRGKKP